MTSHRLADALRVAMHMADILPKRKTPKAAAKEAGYLYVIQVGDAVKVGITGSPKKRLAGLRSQIGKDLERVCVFDASNAREAEKAVHTHFHAHRTIGEWFRVPFEQAVFYIAMNVCPNNC